MEGTLLQPLVSAIVSTYNSECFIRGCIEDLEQQTIAHQIEIIVIDSASPQNEGAIVRELQGRYGNIRYLRTDQRETVYAAWNRGIALARGRYVTNANTDDRHRRDAFELMARVMDSRPGIDLVYGDVLITKTPYETFEHHTLSGRYNWYDWDRNILLDKGCFIGPQPMWRRSLHQLYGGFDPTYVTSGDYEFWLRISQTSDFFHIRQPLGLYLAHPDSIEHQNEDRKGSENSKILNIYRRAVKDGCIVGLIPLQKLGTFVEEKCYGLPYADLTQLIGFIEARLMPRAELSGSRMGNYHRIKAKLLGNGEATAQLIEEDVSIVEHLLLGSREWYVNRRSVEDTCADDALLRLEILSTAVQKARLLFQRNDVDGAVSMLLNQGIKAAASSPVAYLELADILIAAGRHEDALQVLPEMPLNTNPAYKYEIEAICHCALGNDSLAEQAARQVIVCDGKYPRARVVLGTLAARRGDIAEAEKQFRRAIDADPSCSGGWLSLGMLQWGQGKQADAWLSVKRSVVVGPLNSQALAIMRDMAQKLGHQADALQTFAASLSLYPDCRHLALNHAGVLAEWGQEPAALDACEAFLVKFGVDDALLRLAIELRGTRGLYARLAEAGGQSVSLCLIVRDEEASLPRCLASLKPVVHEMIIMDTGSTDRTVDIATAFGAKVYSHAWNGNFSAARNHGIDQAAGGWILIMDADEVISKLDYEQIGLAVAASTGKREAWSVLTRNYTDKVQAKGWTANDGAYPDDEAADGWQPSWKVRLFPNQKQIRFRGDVHEMVEASLRGSGYEIRKASFVVHHYGELEADAATAAEKQRRYFESGMKKLEQNPDDLAAMAELAVQAGELGEFEQAIVLWDRVLAKAPDTVEALFNKGYCLMGMKRYAEALAVSRRALELDTTHKEAAFNYGTCELYAGAPERALAVIGAIAEQNPDYPLLQAIMTVLLLAGGEVEQASVCFQNLKRMNFAIQKYVDERIERLEQVGQGERAKAISEAMAKMLKG